MIWIIIIIFFAVHKFLAKIQFFFILPMKKHLIIKVFILFAKTARNTASVRPSRLLRKLISHYFHSLISIPRKIIIFAASNTIT